MDRYTNLAAGRKLHDDELDCPHHFRPERVITSNGATQVKLYCRQCNARTDAIKHEHFASDEIAGMPVHHDNACTACDGVGCDGCVADPCKRCGKYEHVEIHHYAPRYAFGDDCERWAKGPLCRPCHEMWHKVMDPAMASQRVA